MSARRITATVALAALAVLTAILAADVRAWPAALERGDAVYALHPAAARWSATTHLGGLAETMLGTTEDLAARRGLQLYDAANALQQASPYEEDVETARVRAANALDQPGNTSNRAVASQARTLQGVLAFEAAERGGGTSQIDAAIADFTSALELDSANDAAKFDLELLLRLGQTQPSRYASSRGRSVARSHHRGPAGAAGGRLGAAGTPAGHGY